MSINAIVESVIAYPSMCRISLHGPERGQTELCCVDEKYPRDVSLLVGEQIWGGANSILLGQTEIADRIGYVSIKFKVDSIAAVIEKEANRSTGKIQGEGQ